MSIILNSINSGLILSLIAISFYVCSSKLKFANIALGSCFCVSGFLSALLFNFTGSLFLAVIIPFLFNIILAICNIIFIKLKIDKFLSNILILGLSNIIINYISINPRLFENSISVNYSLNEFSLFSILVIINIFAFFTFSLLIKKDNSFINSLYILSLANIFSGFAGLFNVIKSTVLNFDYVTPVIISITAFLVSRLFLGKYQKISTKLLLLITSSIIVSQLYELLIVFKFDFITINALYIFLAVVIEVYLKLHYSRFSIYDDISLLDNITSTSEGKKSFTSIDFVNAIKSQYI